MSVQGNLFNDESARRIASAVRIVEANDGPPRSGSAPAALRGRPIVRVTLDEDLKSGGTAQATPHAFDGSDWSSGTGTVTVRSIEEPTSEVVFKSGAVVLAFWKPGVGYLVIGESVPASTAEDVADLTGCPCFPCNDDTDAQVSCSAFSGPAVDGYGFGPPKPVCCPDAHNDGFVKLGHVTDCEWESDETFDCGSGYGSSRWRMTADADWTKVELNTEDGVIRYRKRTDEFRPLCTNQLDLDLTAGLPACNGLSCTICLFPFPFPIGSCNPFDKPIAQRWSVPIAGVPATPTFLWNCGLFNRVWNLVSGTSNNGCVFSEFVAASCLDQLSSCDINAVLNVATDPVTLKFLQVGDTVSKSGLLWSQYELARDSFDPLATNTLSKVFDASDEHPDNCGPWPETATVSPESP